MAQQKVQAESQSLQPTALLSLFKLDGTNIGMSTIYYLYDGSNNNFSSLVFGGQSYMSFPIVISNLGFDGQGTVVRPKVTVSNIGGFISSLLLQEQDLVGAQVSITKVFARFIDAVNFKNNVSPYTPDANAAYAPEVYNIVRKVKENQQVVQWELGPPFDTTNVRLPNRIMLANTCGWRYRDPLSCGYNGPPIADFNNNLFIGSKYNYTSLSNKGTWSSATTYNQQDYITISSTNQALLNVPLVFVCTTNGTKNVSPLFPNTSWVQDSCSRTILGCSNRFAWPATLPYGGFQGIVRSPRVNGYTDNYGA